MNKLANKMMLDCMIAKISYKEGLLDLCDQLEKISNAPNMIIVVSQLRAGTVWTGHFLIIAPHVFSKFNKTFYIDDLFTSDWIRHALQLN